MRSFLISGFCDALDWRPLYLQESSVAHAACSLCGLVSKKAARLPCDHTLCSICHQASERRGSTCPLDEESFADDDIVHLDIPQGYIEKRKVACSNAPSGCDFVGQASRLLDHYKQCTFHVVPCPRCQSSVLRTELVGHYKDGCCSASTTPTPIQKPATLNSDRVDGTSKELKREVLKISEELSCLQTSLNQFLEDMRTSERKTNKELKDAMLKISEDLSNLHTSIKHCRDSKHSIRIGTQGLAAPNVETATVEDTVKTHVTQELRSQSGKIMKAIEKVSDCVLGFCGPKEFHWYFKGWEALKKKSSEKSALEYGPFLYVRGYRVCCVISLKKINEQLNLGIHLNIVPGANDSMLEWPFSLTYTLGVIHPKDKTKRKKIKIDASQNPDFFQIPKGGGNDVRGTYTLSTANELERDEFVKDDSLHFFLQVEP